MRAPDFQAELALLDPHTIELRRDERQRLTLEVHTADGVGITHEEVRLVRCFPLREPHRLIGVLSAEGRHLGLILDPDECAPATRALLAAELSQRYFVPTITAVHALRLKTGLQSWEVSTDRGPRSFEVRERDDYRQLPGGRLLIRDVDGNRYEIPDTGALEPRIVDLIEQVL